MAPRATRVAAMCSSPDDGEGPMLVDEGEASLHLTKTLDASSHWQRAAARQDDHHNAERHRARDILRHLDRPLPSPDVWPQRPLLLRATPGSGTVVRGVRLSSEERYLPHLGNGGPCALPINTGHEEEGRCLVIDFETQLFKGTAMLRVKGATNALGDDLRGPSATGTAPSYFDGKKRTFAAVVRGRFKVPGVPVASCFTGQAFDRPPVRPPPRFVVWGAVRIISHLAPQLRARLHGDRPLFLSPLASAAQVVRCRRTHDEVASDTRAATLCEEEKHCARADPTIEETLVEPRADDPASLFVELRCAQENGRHAPSQKRLRRRDTTSERARTAARKRAVDDFSARNDAGPTFDAEVQYTFEFYQHLLAFGDDDLALDLGRALGKHNLSGVLHGQPLKFMAAHCTSNKSHGEDDLRYLWSFDIWHESLYSDAFAFDKEGRE